MFALPSKQARKFETSNEIAIKKEKRQRCRQIGISKNMLLVN
jgi:hypothetical protein